MKVSSTFIPLRLTRRGVELRLEGSLKNLDPVLNRALAKAHYWQYLLDSGMMKSGSEIARDEGLDPSVVNEILRLTLLAPDIADSIMNGQQPANLSLIWFQRHPLPLDWDQQRTLMEAIRSQKWN